MSGGDVSVLIHGLCRRCCQKAAAQLSRGGVDAASPGADVSRFLGLQYRCA